jgi:hypothetical protein
MKAVVCLSLGALTLVAAGGCGGADAPGQTTSGVGGTGGVLTGANAASTSAGGPGATTGASSAATGAAGSGGAGGNAPFCPPAGPFVGEKLLAPSKQWTWIDVPGAKCRDGSKTGFGVRLNPASDKLYIYLEGGGACFNGSTCAISLGAFGSAAFGAWAGTVGQLGIFDPLPAQNPVRDWNAVYVPYCTGDVHVGSVSDQSVPGGPSAQEFVGYENINLYLQRLIPTFANASQVMLTGVSAGGFGAAFNYDRVAKAFCPTPVVLLDDSGPPMADKYLAPCLQKQWRGLWDIDKTLPPSCSGCTEPDGGGIVNYASYLSARWPESRMGLISSTHDSVISTFFGFGHDTCGAPLPLTGAEYEAGLVDLRDAYLGASGHWGTYYVNSVTHTYLIGPGFYTTQVGNKPLTSWVKELLDGQTSNISP